MDQKSSLTSEAAFNAHGLFEPDNYSSETVESDTRRSSFKLSGTQPIGDMMVCWLRNERGKR